MLAPNPLFHVSKKLIDVNTTYHKLNFISPEHMAAEFYAHSHHNNQTMPTHQAPWSNLWPWRCGHELIPVQKQHLNSPPHSENDCQ